ncbi:MAG: glycosyltransferase [Firmicutes bacterium]|nr:glycosyltransferase [Bacillota bacterium]
MKVLQISKYQYPYIGGTEQVARDIVNALQNDDTIEQKIICFNEDASDGDYICHRGETVHDIVDGIEVIRCGCFAKVASQSLSMTYFNELKKVLKEFSPDIVILHYPNPFVTNFLLSMLSKDIELIVYWHLDITKQKFLGKLFHRQNIKLLKRANKVVATSPNYIAGSPYLSKFRDKCVVVPNCIRTERLEATDLVKRKASDIRAKNKDKTLIFACGRHVPYKGMTYLVKASKYLDENFRIYIGGKGELTEELKKEADGDDKIAFLGRVSDDDLKAYYMACDIFAFPSITKNEAFGIALAEAMYMGLPAVTFTIPGSGVNYVSVNGETGIECPNGDWKAFAEALKKLGDDKNLSEKYSKNAKKRVEDKFMFEQFAENIKGLINGI